MKYLFSGLKISFFAMLILFISGCEYLVHENTASPTINCAEIIDGPCLTGKKAGDENPMLVRLTAQENNSLLVEVYNTEYCCATDSLNLDFSMDTTSIQIIIEDLGPYSRCFCPHEISFPIENMGNETYSLFLLESENSYNREKVSVQFLYNNDLDTTVAATPYKSPEPDTGLAYEGVFLGGCNGGEVKKAGLIPETGNDTIYFTQHQDSLFVFAGINELCCIEYESTSEVSGDTIFMYVNETSRMDCDCYCYYTFTYVYTGYDGSDLIYKLLLNNTTIMSGSIDPE